jgi:hypothetical protein
LALALVLWGLLIMVYAQAAQVADWTAMSKTHVPLANFGDIASPVRYGLMSLLSAACFGSAFGVLSAFHVAGFRPLLLTILVLLLSVVWPGHMIHWLVWMAIYSMYMAIKFQDPSSTVSSPSVNEWMTGMYLDDYVPMIAAVFYLLAVVLASRKLRSSTSETSERVDDTA